MSMVGMEYGEAITAQNSDTDANAAAAMSMRTNAAS
jgi:hypothetical protein